MMQWSCSNEKINIYVSFIFLKKELSREKDLHAYEEDFFSNTVTPFDVLVLHDAMSLRKMLFYPRCVDSLCTVHNCMFTLHHRRFKRQISAVLLDQHSSRSCQRLSAPSHRLALFD